VKVTEIRQRIRALHHADRTPEKRIKRGLRKPFFAPSRSTGSGYEAAQGITDDPVTFDFAKLLFMGIRCGFSEQEIGRITYGKRVLMFE